MEQQQELQLVIIPQHITGFCLPYTKSLLHFIKESDEYREALTTERDLIKVRTPGFYEAVKLLAKHLGLYIGDSSCVENILKFVEGIETICSLFTTETEQSSSFMGVNFHEVKKLIDFVKSCEEYNQETDMSGNVIIKTKGLYLALKQLHLIFPGTPSFHDIFCKDSKGLSFSKEKFNYIVSELETIEEVFKK